MTSSDQLQEAIKSATHERLRVTLLAICSKSEEASKLAGEELLVQSSATKKRKSDDEHSNVRYDMCIQCEKEFDTTTNGPERCQWHDGMLEVDFDGDFWADHDEDCHGLIDTDEMRKEYPDGFIWDCCNTHGGGGVELESYKGQPEENMEGCSKGPHLGEIEIKGKR